MTAGLDQASRPLVLLVEDREDSLELRKNLFESYNCSAVAVRSRREAEVQRARTPRPDLVVTDIHMPESQSEDDDDTSGVDLARYIKENFVGLPVAGYSAHFNEGDLPDPEGTFDLMFAKRGQRSENLAAQIHDCVSLAIQSRAERVAASADRLDDLRRAYEQMHAPHEVERSLALDMGATTVEGDLGRNGYRLRLVSTSESERVIGAPIVVWIVTDPSGVFSEVYGQPELFASGATEEESLASLLELVELLARTLPDEPAAAFSASRRIYAFLSRLADRLR